MLSVEQVGRLEPPVVWTLHDMWAFAGMEHYVDEEATRWQDGYTPSNRPPGESGPDLALWVWRRKRTAWQRRFHIVAPSKWLADCASRSALLASWPISVIPNPVPVDVFRPRPVEISRRMFGLPRDTPLVLFGSLAGQEDHRKGVDLLFALLERVARMRPDAEAVVFGSHTPGGSHRSPLRVHWVGHIGDAVQLSHLYSAADVMVVPSRQENLPQTGTEAQACGTPVAAFSTGGVPEVLDPGHTGHLAEPFHVSDLAHGVLQLLDRPDRQRMREAARKRAVMRWSPAVVARSYVELYSTAIALHEENST